MRILIMGLPDSGKTTLAQIISKRLNAVWLNADKVRTESNDWDFSEEGRKRQAMRMWTFAEEAVDANRIVVADFVCPTESTRQDFNADYTVWMNTIKESKYEDTNKMFEEPKNPNFVVTHFEVEMWAFLIIQEIREKMDENTRH
jgi:adenylylsulfate kinase